MFNLLFDAARQGDWVCDEFPLPIRCHFDGHGFQVYLEEIDQNF